LQIGLDDHRLWRYFPETYDLSSTQRRAHDYPDPGSDDFWSRYAEPVVEFMQAAERLAWALWALHQKTSGVNGAEPHVPIRGQAIINELAAHVSPGIFYTGRSLSRAKTCSGWNGDTLLGHYAAMAAFKLGPGAMLRICKCGAPFITSKSNRRHCTTRCRTAAATAARRSKKAPVQGKEGSSA
jgi:hypothetical protein